MQYDLLVRACDGIPYLLEFDIVNEDSEKIDLEERELGYRYAFLKKTEELCFASMSLEDGYTIEEINEHLPLE